MPGPWLLSHSWTWRSEWITISKIKVQLFVLHYQPLSLESHALLKDWILQGTSLPIHMLHTFADLNIWNSISW